MRLCLPLILALLPVAAPAQGIEDQVSENLFACDRQQTLSLTIISREPGRPWLAVTWVDGRLVTMENKGSMEKPAFTQVNPDDGAGYDWRQTSDTHAELGWTGEGAKRQVILTCDTSGEGGY